MNPNNKRNKAPNNVKEHKINREIRAYHVYLIDSDSEKGRVLSFNDALGLAVEQGLDLVQIAMNDQGPVCKIMDYGRYCFEKNKNKVKVKKNEQKIIQINPNIQKNDLLVKLKQAQTFLQAKFKVQVIAKLQGRQADYPELVMDMFNQFIEFCKEEAKVFVDPKIEGKRGLLILNPK